MGETVTILTVFMYSHCVKLYRIYALKLFCCFLTADNNEDRLRELMLLVYFFITRSLEQLLVSLQWGRQQTYYPSAQPLSTGDLAAANHKLADAINSHLLGNTTASGVVKGSSATPEQLCSTPAEKMAEKVPTPFQT